MKPLDEIIRDWVSPVLREAGFSKRGRTFLYVAESGTRVGVRVTSYSTGRFDGEFYLELEVAPKIWTQYHPYNGSGIYGIWTRNLMVPGKNPREIGAFADRWQINVGDEAAGRLLQGAIEEALPEVLALAEPGAMLRWSREHAEAGLTFRMSRERAVALLLAVDGPSEELDQRLAALERKPLQDDLVPFIRGYLESWTPEPATDVDG